MDGEAEDGETEVGAVDEDLSVSDPIDGLLGHEPVVADDGNDVENLDADQSEARETQSE